MKLLWYSISNVMMHLSTQQNNCSISIWDCHNSSHRSETWFGVQVYGAVYHGQQYVAPLNTCTVIVFTSERLVLLKLACSVLCNLEWKSTKTRKLRLCQSSIYPAIGPWNMGHWCMCTHAEESLSVHRRFPSIPRELGMARGRFYCFPVLWEWY